MTYEMTAYNIMTLRGAGFSVHELASTFDMTEKEYLKAERKVLRDRVQKVVTKVAPSKKGPDFQMWDDFNALAMYLKLYASEVIKDMQIVCK